MTTFIKAEEQTYSLFNFVHSLNQDIETLEDSNKQIERQIRYRQMEWEVSDSRKRDTILDMENEINTIKRTISTKEEEIVKVKKMIKDIEPFIKELMYKFQSSPLAESLLVSHDHMIDEVTSFNENNVRGFLAAAEEYIGNLLAVIANKSQLENPIIKALPLEKMIEKNFNRQPIKVNVLKLI